MFVGTRYDERVVEALVEACETGQINAASVKLRSRRMAEHSPGSVTPLVEPAVEQPQTA